MSNEEKKEKVIRVKNLTIYAENVDVVRERRPREYERQEEQREYRDPWEFLFGRPRGDYQQEEAQEEGRDK